MKTCQNQGKSQNYELKS